MIVHINTHKLLLIQLESLTSPSHRHHGLRVVHPLQTEASDSGQSGDNNIGLVGSAGPVVSIEFKSSGTCTSKQTLRPGQAELLTHPHTVGAAIGYTSRGWVCREDRKSQKHSE